MGTNLPICCPEAGIAEQPSRKRAPLNQLGRRIGTSRAKYCLNLSAALPARQQNPCGAPPAFESGATLVARWGETASLQSFALRETIEVLSEAEEWTWGLQGA